MTACPNPRCRHRTKRKLRPLVISILPNPNKSDDNGETCQHQISSTSRHEHITRMFTTHPSLSTHFEPPVFSPGVPSRDLRNRIKFLEYANQAGLIPEVELEGITRAVREQTVQTISSTEDDGNSNVSRGDDAGISTKLGQQLTVSQKEEVCDGNNETNHDQNGNKNTGESKHVTIDPFKYIASVTRIEPSISTDDQSTEQTNDATENMATKKKKWYPTEETKTLVPISPLRQGSQADIALPYSMELWRKGKALNRDRSVFACTLAHLIAMKTLIGDGPKDDVTGDDGTNAFDFILEDNVRAFVGLDDMACGKGINDDENNNQEWTGWSCECANRIWDSIESSQSVTQNTNEGNQGNIQSQMMESQECHMRFYGWLGSLPNLSWLYEKHIPRSAFAVHSSGSHLAEGGKDGVGTSVNNGVKLCAVFPRPIKDDMDLDCEPAPKSSQNTQSKNHSEEETLLESSKQRDTSTKSKEPHFTTPGGTAIFGAFAYTLSSTAYRSIITQLQNDVGAMLWKGKKMRAYKVKPIDKILPRLIKDQFGRNSIHVSKKVAFVRGPMLGSLLHQHWDKAFCESTELQFCLSCSDFGSEESKIDVDGARVWDHVWLPENERKIVEYRKKTGNWLTKEEFKNTIENEE